MGKKEKAEEWSQIDQGQALIFIMHKIRCGTEQYSYEQRDILGRGTFSNVYKALSSKGQNVAIKLMDKSKLIKNYGTDIINYLMKEGQIMCRLSQLESPHIVKIFNCIKAQNYIIFVTQLCEGTIIDFFNKNPSISINQKLKYFYQILQGIKLVHDQGISHRDIKCDNIYIKNGKAKIGDFGFATFQKGRTILGSPAFMAPQIILNQPYDCKADIWSIGITLYEMLLDRLPFSFHSLDDAKIFFSQKKIDIQESIIPKQIMKLLYYILQVDPSKRPSAEQILTWPLFKAFEESSNPIVSFVQQVLSRAVFARETAEQVKSSSSFLLKVVLLKKATFSLYELSEIQRSECLREWKAEWLKEQSQQKQKLKSSISSQLKQSIKQFQSQHSKLRKSVSQSSDQQFWMNVVQLIDNDFKKNIANKLLADLIEISLKTDPSLPVQRLKRILLWTPLI